MEMSSALLVGLLAILGYLTLRLATRISAVQLQNASYKSTPSLVLLSASSAACMIRVIMLVESSFLKILFSIDVGFLLLMLLLHFKKLKLAVQARKTEEA